MSTRSRCGALLLVAAIALAACSNDEEPSPVIGGTTTSASTAQNIAIAVASGKVTGGGRHKVARGTRVHLVVTADVSDEVHLHGYDKKADVAPGAPAAIDLVVDIPGIFEVELESHSQHLADLEVTG